MAEGSAATQQPWSFSGMLSDPNFQLLLANMGRQMDPEGAGGVIGTAAANMISSKAAQSAIEKRDAARSAQIKQLIDLHGGITKPDRPGLNSVKATPSGSYTFDLNLPEPRNITSTPEYGAFSNTLRDIAATRPTNVAPAQPPARTQTAPVITPATTAPVPVTNAPAPIRTAAARRDPSILDIAPFY
jgi:hypothetical protein